MPRLRHSFCIDRPSETALHGRSSRMGMILCVEFSRCSVSLKVPDLENQFLFALSFFSITIKQVILETVQQREKILRRSPILKFPKMVNGAASPHQFCAVVSVSPRITRTVPHMESLFILVHKDISHLGSPPGGLNLCRVQTAICMVLSLSVFGTCMVDGLRGHMGTRESLTNR